MKEQTDKISFVFLRHGKALNGENDSDRPLSKEGITQAEKCASFFRKNNKTFDLIITSSARRTKETAHEILKFLEQDPKIVEIHEIYEPLDETTRKHVEWLLKNLQSKPLKYYLTSEHKNYWKMYTDSAFSVIQQNITQYKPNSILIVGHRNIINSLGLCIAPSTKELLEVYFDYCEGFEISPANIITILKTSNFV